MQPTPPHHELKLIIDANYGRDGGWHVLSESDTPLALLTDCQWGEMFWDSYIVEPIDGHTETLTVDFWHPDCHRLRSVAFPDYVIDVYGGYLPDEARVSLRFAYIKVCFGFVDYLRSPLYALKHFCRFGFPP